MTTGRSAASASSQAASTSSGRSTRMPRSPSRSAYPAYGKCGSAWLVSKRGSPSVSRCSHGDLGQLAVVQHEHDEPRVVPVLPPAGDGDELGDAVHLHGAVADERDHRTSGPLELGRETVRQARAHRRERGRQVRLDPGRQGQVPRVPVGHRADVDADLGVAGSRGDSARTTRSGLSGSAGPSARSCAISCQRPTWATTWSRHADVLRSSSRGSNASRVRRRRRSAPPRRVSVAEVPSVEVHLHGAGLAGLRVVLGPGVVGADHEQGVALVHEPAGRRGAEVAHDAAAGRQRLVHHGLPAGWS